MLIRLDTRASQTFHWSETLHLEGAKGDGIWEDLELGDIEVVGDVMRIGNEWRLGATLRYRRTLPCDRCLDPVVSAVASEFHWILRRGTVTPGQDAALEVAAAVEVEEGCLQLVGEWLDTVPLVREQVLLDLPARVLCHESCPGLCPVCGAHRKREGCRCGPRAADPRWAALSKLHVATSRPQDADCAREE